MVSEDFAKFVESQQETDAEARVNWAETRDYWLAELDSLYGTIADFLREYVGHGITYEFSEIELNEPSIGRYLARRMDIKIGRQHVSLVPIGTLLVACKGRVDVEGAAGRGRLLLVDEKVRRAADLIRVTVHAGTEIPSPPVPEPEPVWAWKILTNVEAVFEDLDKENFLRLLMETTGA